MPHRQENYPDHNDINYFYDLPGNSPGALSVSAQALQPEFYLIDYGPTEVSRSKLSKPEDCSRYLDQDTVSWIDVQGLGDLDLLQRLGNVFQLHPLILEDIVNIPQRSKVETYDNQLVIITHMVFFLPKQRRFISEQVSFILGEHYLLTVQEKPYNDCFEPIRQRIQLNKGNIRRMGPDYLAYSLLDAIIDGFFPVLEAYGDYLEEIEDQVVDKPRQRTLQRIYKIKRELSNLRRLIWLQRDAISILIRDSDSLIDSSLHIYLRDCYDHAVQLLDVVESFREACSGLMDIYLSSVSNRMNEVMKTLTVISTIFIPLTFISGLYGMNFNPAASPLNMPELSWYWGYPTALLVMTLIAGGLVYFFWRRGWFQRFS